MFSKKLVKNVSISTLGLLLGFTLGVCFVTNVVTKKITCSQSIAGTVFMIKWEK